MSRSRLVTLADDAHTHIALVQVGEVVADEAAQQSHQIAISDSGRDQFSELKENMVRYRYAEIAGGSHRPAQRFDAAAMAFERGRPRAAAQRPLPSMMMATCRGASKPSLPAAAALSRCL